MLAHYKTLLFDIDGTLLDFHKAQKTAFDTLLTHYGVVNTHQLFEQYTQLNQQLWQQYEQGLLSKETVLSTRFARFFEGLHVDVNAVEADNLYRHYLTQGHQLFHGALTLVQKVAKTHQLAIVTNGVYDTQIARLKNNHLLPFFKHIFVSDKIGFQKPDKRFFYTVFSTLNITNLSQTLIIGDSFDADIVGGYYADIDTCWINATNQSIDSTITPTMTIKHISDLLYK